MDHALADRLIEMASAQEDAVGAVFRWVLADDVAAAAFATHVGWHPGQDAVAIWASADTAPRPVWLADWPDAPPVVRHLRDVTAGHLGPLRQVVEGRGWPGRSLVGEDGSDAAWFLAMHADADPDLQRRCIAGLRPAVAAGDADPRHLATLLDRVTSAADGDQLYGTLVVARAGRPVFLVPVRGASGLTLRRATIGLPPVEEDLAEDGGRGQLPYRHLRQTPLFSWPPAVAPHT